MAGTSGSDSQDRKPLNVLCLDGGGVRGVSELLILQHILEQLKRKSGLASVPLPCEVFDLICGTSTGGLIALMLGRLHMSVKDALGCYFELSEKIFGRKGPFIWIRTLWASICTLWGWPMYSGKTLEDCIKEVVTSYGGNQGDPGDPNALLEDLEAGNNTKCRTFVVAVYGSSGDSPPKLFRTYGTQRNDADDCKIWEAARATTAASTFFDPITIGSHPPQRFIDGALGGANNPSRLALDEIEEIFPDREIGCFLSLGTGVPKVPRWRKDLFNVAKSSAKLLTSCEAVDALVHNEFVRRARSTAHPGAYFRFSVERGLASITLDEWNRHEEMGAVTTGYIVHHERRAKVDNCVEKLDQRVKEIHTQMTQMEDLESLL